MSCPGCNAVGCRPARPVPQPVEGAEVSRSDLGSQATRCHLPHVVLSEIVEELGIDAAPDSSCPQEVCHAADCRCHFCQTTHHEDQLFHGYLDHIQHDHRES